MTTTPEEPADDPDVTPNGEPDDSPEPVAPDAPGPDPSTSPNAEPPDEL